MRGVSRFASEKMKTEKISLEKQSVVLKELVK